MQAFSDSVDSNRTNTGAPRGNQSAILKYIGRQFKIFKFTTMIQFLRLQYKHPRKVHIKIIQTVTPGQILAPKEWFRV